jgi:hypothetical protein
MGGYLFRPGSVSFKSFPVNLKPPLTLIKPGGAEEKQFYKVAIVIEGSVYSTEFLTVEYS